MKKQEMKNLLLDMLGRVLSGTNFRLKKSEDAYVRKIVGGRQMLGLPLLDYNPEFHFSLTICVRLEAVEETFHRFSGSPPKYHSMSETTITRLDYFGSSVSECMTRLKGAAILHADQPAPLRDRHRPAGLSRSGHPRPAHPRPLAAGDHRRRHAFSRLVDVPASIDVCAR